MPVAVSPIKVRSTYVTDIRYREDAAGWNKPEDLPFSNIRSFREQKLGNCEGSVCALAILILFSAAVFDMK